MKKNQQANTVLTIYAEDQPGLISQLIYPFKRNDFKLYSLDVARTDLHDRIVITLEAFLPLPELQPFLCRVRETNGVIAVKLEKDAGHLQKTGHYYLSPEALNPALQQLVRQFGAEISLITDEHLLIAKTATDSELLGLYNQLEGPHLLGFCKSTLPASRFPMTANSSESGAPNGTI